MIRAVFARELRGSLGALAVVSASLACCAVAITSMFSPELAKVLASPHSKSTVAASIAAAVIASVLAATALSGLAAVLAAEALFPGVLDLAAMARVNLGLLAFQLFMAGICLLSALALRRPTRAPSGQQCASRSSGRRSPRGRSRRSPDATSAYKAASHGPGANR